jgi:hypothetical protein
MSGTVKSAELILRRITSYVEDVDYILRRELPDEAEKDAIAGQLRYIELKLRGIFHMVDRYAI